MSNGELVENSRTWIIPKLMIAYVAIALPLALVSTWAGGSPRTFVAHINGCLVVLALRWLIQLPQRPYRAELAERRWKAEQGELAEYRARAQQQPTQS